MQSDAYHTTLPFVDGNVGIVYTLQACIVVLYRQALGTPKRSYAACLTRLYLQSPFNICREVDLTERRKSGISRWGCSQSFLVTCQPLGDARERARVALALCFLALLVVKTMCCLFLAAPSGLLFRTWTKCRGFPAR